MDLIISVPGEAEVTSLAAWLRGDHSPAGRIHVVHSPPSPSVVHGPPPQIQVLVGTTSALASVVGAVRTWLHSRSEPVELTIQGPSGQTVVLTATSPEDAAEITRVLAAPESRQRHESIATADEITTQDNHAPSGPPPGIVTTERHTPPGPPLDPDDDWPLDLEGK